MTLHEDLGRQGAKRSSWTKVHYRDLALKVCHENPDADVEELAEIFLAALEKHPEFMESIAIYIMANIRAALTPRSQPVTDLETRVIKQVAAKVLMKLPMPGGKTLGQSTGAECIKAGGWLAAVGHKIGRRNIVGEKLKEKDLQAMWSKK